MPYRRGESYAINACGRLWERFNTVKSDLKFAGLLKRRKNSTNKIPCSVVSSETNLANGAQNPLILFCIMLRSYLALILN